MSTVLKNSLAPTTSPERTLGAGRTSAFRMARTDIGAGLTLWPLWVQLGWNDILQRYRRSVLGPLWLTLSMAIMVVALGIVYAELFEAPLQDFMPFLCVGLLVWNFISSFFTEGGTLFTGSASYIKQIRLPYSVYVYRSAWSKVIIFAHNFIIYFGVMTYFELWPGAVALCAVPGLLLVILNGALANTCIGLLSARFRDIPQVINSVIQIAFFITPIIWKPELLHGKSYIAEFNPFFHLTEIVRAPLLGSLPALQSYLAVLLMTVVNIVVTGALFTRFRARLSYWV